jgi:phosphatidylinositol glycan class F
MAFVRKALKNIASGNKPRRLRPPNTLSDDPVTDLDLVSLPNAIPKQYPPLILIHAILLSSALVLLPQTPIPHLPLPPPTRGLDKPQLPFLAPITARPVLTLAWQSLGAALLVPWWAGSLRRWAHDGSLGPRSVQLRLAGDPHIRRVRALPISLPVSHPLHLGYLECLHLHCLCGSGVTRSDYFVRSAIHRVRHCLCTRCRSLPFVLTRSLTDARPHFRFVPHTGLLALLIAVYAIFPPTYVLGPPRLGLPLLSVSTGNAVVQNDLWVRIFAERE